MKTICYGIFVMVCEPLGGTMPVDSYCQLYNQVIVSRGDASITAPLSVKKRILANEQLYRRVCGRK